MKCVSLSVILCGVFSVLACGGSGDMDAGVKNAPAFEGIYQLVAASENTAGCDTAGESKLAQLRDHFFVITAADILGQTFVVLDSCSSVSDCQAKRAAQKAKQSYSIEYTFMLGSSSNATTLTGFKATTGGGEGAQCERTYAEHVLTVAADHSVHFESRTKLLADRPQNNGFCEVDTEKSKQEAASRECSRLETLDGSFVQAD